MEATRIEVDAIKETLVNPELEVDAIKEVLSEPDAQWFDLGGRGCVYLRRSTLTLENQKLDGLTVANVGVEKEHRRKGVFSNTVAVVEEAAALMALGFVFVEAILNPVLVPALEKRGYAIRRTTHGPVALGDLILPAPPDDIDAYKLIGTVCPN
jgi:hypothetical protein